MNLRTRGMSYWTGCVMVALSGCSSGISIGHDDSKLKPDAPPCGSPARSSGGATAANAEPDVRGAPATYTAMSFYVVAGDSVCISLALPADEQGQADCKVIELVPDDHCDCTQPGRGPASNTQVAVARNAIGRRAGWVCDGPGQPACSRYCGCELLQMKGDARDSCRQDLDMSPDAAGFCYLDPEHGLGSQALVEPALGCSVPDDKLLRTQAPGLTVPDESNTPLRYTFMACAVKNVEEAPPRPGGGELGAPCGLSVEGHPDLLTVDTDSVRVDTASADCATGLCLLNHVTSNVDLTLPSNSAAYCSCRCDGPAGAGPFCACPNGFECAPLVPDIGLVSTKDIAGSYCVKSGTPTP